MTMPIYEMLKSYRDKKPLPFHMPGHILGRGLFKELKNAGGLDITEIPGSDCLHSPEGVIKEAQELAAGCFGAAYTLFLVNGSTSGIQAMIQAAVRPGGKLIIGRDCHKSVIDSMVMMDAEPVFVMPEMDDDSQIPLGVSAAAVEDALAVNPDAQGILLTRPGYYGTAAALDGIAGIARRYRVPLMIDEAHGAHFIFHDSFPKPALTLGADLCVQSLHKTLPALTQTALLHGSRNSLIERRLVERAASMVQTSSPSYILMASADMARELMENKGRLLYEKLWENIREFERELADSTVVERLKFDRPGVEYDFSRIVLDFRNTCLNGFQAGEILQKRYGIVVEMADFRHLVLIATPFHTHEDFSRLLAALKDISGEFKGVGKKETIPYPRRLPERGLSIRNALFSPIRRVPVSQASGVISAASVIPYPPGIPLINPGEIISGVDVEYLRSLLSSGCTVHGIYDNMVDAVDCKNKIL